MKKNLFLYMSLILLMSLAGTVIAQDSAYHPALSDNFMFAAGAFRSDNTFKIRAEGRTNLGDRIDFGDSVGVDSSNTLGYAQL